MTALERLMAAEKMVAKMMVEIRDEFERERIPLSAEQGLVLARLSDQPTTIGTVAKTAYVGSNISYNIGKLVDGGFLKKEQDAHDQRSFYVSITGKGRNVAAIVEGAVTRNADFGDARKVA